MTVGNPRHQPQPALYVQVLLPDPLQPPVWPVETRTRVSRRVSSQSQAGDTCHCAGTGRNPIHVNVQNVNPDRHNPADPVAGFSAIARNMTGMAVHMKAAGWATAAVGKWDAGMVRFRQCAVCGVRCVCVCVCGGSRCVCVCVCCVYWCAVCRAMLCSVLCCGCCVACCVACGVCCVWATGCGIAHLTRSPCAGHARPHA